MLPLGVNFEGVQLQKVSGIPIAVPGAFGDVTGVSKGEMLRVTLCGALVDAAPCPPSSANLEQLSASISNPITSKPPLVRFAATAPPS